MHKVLQKYINQYIIAYYCVVTPIDKRDFKEIKIPTDFHFSDMKDLHKSSLLIRDFLFGETIEKFYHIELIIRNYLVQSVSNIDFKYFPDFETLFLKFIETSISFDTRDSMLNANKIKYGDESAAENIQKLLNDGIVDKFYADLTNKVPGTEYSNVMHPYVYLYEMLKIEASLIGKYFEEIEKI